MDTSLNALDCLIRPAWEGWLSHRKQKYHAHNTNQDCRSWALCKRGEQYHLMLGHVKDLEIFYRHPGAPKQPHPLFETVEWAPHWDTLGNHASKQNLLSPCAFSQYSSGTRCLFVLFLGQAASVEVSTVLKSWWPCLNQLHVPPQHSKYKALEGGFPARRSSTSFPW